jgi:hypothetical protein
VKSEIVTTLLLLSCGACEPKVRTDMAKSACGESPLASKASLDALMGSGVGALGAKVVVAGATDPSQATAPKQLTCLAKWYGGEAVRGADTWVLKLENGFTIPYDDGEQKSADERFQRPDLEDTFHDPYERLPDLAPVTTADLDPGRYRVEALFFSAYGCTSALVKQRLTSVLFLGREVMIHERVAAALTRVAAKLEKIAVDGPTSPAILSRLSGTFNWRSIAGTDRLSAHAFGIAIDLNADAADYWRWSDDRAWRHALPPEVVRAFEEEGFIWGGRWYHFDTMHFEYRPELLDPACHV